MSGWEHIEIDCYVRAGTRPEPINELVARLRNLADAGTVAELTVHSWPCTVDLDTDVNDRYLDIYEQLDQWAASHDAQIQPPFSVRHIDSSIPGKHGENSSCQYSVSPCRPPESSRVYSLTLWLATRTRHMTWSTRLRRETHLTLSAMPFDRTTRRARRSHCPNTRRPSES